MEIHSPEHPITSVRQFLIHLVIVTVGILIALSLEGLLEWNHHRHLVREARENIRSEIEDNQREISVHLADTAQTRKDHQTVLKWIADITKSRKSSVGTLALSFKRAELSNTSWSTAQAVGALALMDYSEVKRDTDIYRLQEEFIRLESRAEDSAISAMSFFTASQDDPGQAAIGELQQEKAKVQESLTALTIQHQIGLELSKRYTAYLTSK
jgi:hypothetical protein